MTSIQRPLSGEPLRFSLAPGRQPELIDHSLLERTGRTARTLVKDGPLRVTLVALGPGGALAAHEANGPITVQVLSGRVAFRVGEDVQTLEEGDLLSLGGGITHSVASEGGGVFLLTVATVARP